MRIAISMTSCLYARFDHVINKTIMGGIVLVREGLAAVLKRKEYLLPAARSVGIREGTKTLLQAIIF